LAGLFGGVMSKSTVSRVWRRIKADWEAWGARDLGNEDVVRLILDGTGTRNFLPLCQPAPSSTSATCSSSPIVEAKASRNACIPALFASGRISAKALSVPGSTAAKI
jgi:hypothetical protein